jgi:hypothetical protein
MGWVLCNARNFRYYAPVSLCDPMRRSVEQLVAESIALWQRGATCLPPLGRRFTTAQQCQKEALLDQFLASMESEALRVPRTKTERARVHERISAAFTQFARTALELEDRHLDLLLDRGFPAVGASLGRLARQFDPAVGTAEIFQACRNAWAACGLQALFGLPMTVTPAIFAYSMLYPYSDNYLDDASVPRERKLSFSAQFRHRLAGECVPASNDREEAIWKLVGMIESGYARAEYPEVYASLLAIHRSQEESIRLLQRGQEDAADVLPVVFTKGGASVLADAYLASGRLTDAEAGFAFDWGVLLQLGDDLQDVREDTAAGLRTVFSTAAAMGPLDALTNRTFQFALHVMNRMEALTGAPEALKDLLRRSSISLVVRAAGALREHYSDTWINEIETYSPFRFAFLSSRKEKLARHKGRLAGLFEAFLAGSEDEPVFPMLPSSLLM